MPPAIRPSMDTLRQGSWQYNSRHSPYPRLCLPTSAMSRTLRLHGRMPRMRSSRPRWPAEICERTREAPRSWRARSQASEAGTCWACAQKAAEPEMFSMRSRRRQPRKEDVFKALGQMAKRFGTRAGESLATRGKGAQSARRGNHAFTGGLAVLQRGNEGRRKPTLGRRPAPSLKRAIEIDPKFAMAYAYLGELRRPRRDRNCRRRMSPRPMNYGIGSATGKTISSPSTTTGR